MPIQYGPPSLPAPGAPLLSGSFAGAFARKPAAPVKKPASSKAAPVSQTLSQVANQRVNQQLAPQIAAQNAFNAQQNQVIQNFAAALMGKVQPVAGQIGQAYDSAIQQQGALSSAAANYLQQANPSGPVADMLRQAGAPQSQIDQVSGNLGQTFGGGAGVLSFLGGAVPGGQLAANKASAVTEASQLPLLAGLKGQEDLSSALWQQGQDRRNLLATRPALYQQAAQDIRTNNAARATAALNQQKYAHSVRQDQIANRLKVNTLNQRTAIFNATQNMKADQFRQKEGETKREFDARLQVDKDKATINAYVQLSKLGLSQAALDAQMTKWSQQYDQNAQKITISQQQGNTRNAIAQQRADTAASIAAYKQAHPTVHTKTVKIQGGTALVNSDTGAVIATYKGPTSATAASGGKFTNSDVNTLADAIATWHSGQTGTSNGQPVIDPSAQKSWKDAYTSALTRLPNTPGGRAKALQLVNAEYGAPETIGFNSAKSDVTDGMSVTDSVKIVLQHQSDGTLPIPINSAIQGIARARGMSVKQVRALFAAAASQQGLSGLTVPDLGGTLSLPGTQKAFPGLPHPAVTGPFGIPRKTPWGG